MSNSVHRAFVETFSTPSGKEVLDFLKFHCFMKPGEKTAITHGDDQITFRYGRMTLYQIIEYMLNPEHFVEQPKQQKKQGVFSV